MAAQRKLAVVTFVLVVVSGCVKLEDGFEGLFAFAVGCPSATTEAQT